jgi:hypothetical protein
MKFFVVLSVFAMLLLSSCGGSTKELDAFIAAKDEVISAWAKEADSNPTEAGVDNMRKTFESKKADLIAKREAVEKAKLSSNSLNRLLDSEDMDQNMTKAIGGKFASAPSAVGEKFRALAKDYLAAVKRPGTI